MVCKEKVIKVDFYDHNIYNVYIGKRKASRMGYQENVIRNIARNLEKEHGKLDEVRCISGVGKCNMELVYADGYIQHVGNTNPAAYDINMINFGYRGSATRYFYEFLDESGYEFTYEDLSKIKNGSVLRPKKEVSNI